MDKTHIPHSTLEAKQQSEQLEHSNSPLLITKTVPANILLDRELNLHEPLGMFYLVFVFVQLENQQ